MPDDDDVLFSKTSLPINVVVARTTVDASDPATVSVVRLAGVDATFLTTVAVRDLSTVDRSPCLAESVGPNWAELAAERRGSSIGRT